MSKCVIRDGNLLVHTLNGEIHNEDGPAIVAKGPIEQPWDTIGNYSKNKYFLFGEAYSFEEWLVKLEEMGVDPEKIMYFRMEHGS